MKKELYPPSMIRRLSKDSVDFGDFLSALSLELCHQDVVTRYADTLPDIYRSQGRAIMLEEIIKLFKGENERKNADAR